LNAHNNGTSDELGLDAYLDNHYPEFEEQQSSSSNAVSFPWDDHKTRSNSSKFVPASKVSLYDDNNNINPQIENNRKWQWDPPAPLVGIVYLTSSQNYGDLLHVGELNIGIILEPAFRKKGYARKAIEKVLETAFADHTCHRIQAIILDTWAKDRALNLFMQS
jgi:RimJ/RimL family protein N-acetyltransferase